MAEATPTRRARPKSPHMQIYKWPVTMLTSITHRVTGVGNAIGTLLLAAWLVSLATGPEAHAAMTGFLASPFGRFLLLGFTWSLVYHSLNGMRHLWWDTGRGLDVETATATGVIVLVLSVLFTLALFSMGYSVAGGA